MYYRVLVASQRFHGKESLTYKSTDRLDIGQLVAVPLQQKAVVGIIEAIAQKPSFETKMITDSWPLVVPPQSLALLKWLAAYYPSPLGLITELFTPPSMSKKLPEFSDNSFPFQGSKLPTPTTEQAKILAVINKTASQSILLHGDTGTGKTRIYAELASRALEKRKSAIILTPEIGLTGPLLDTFTKAFGKRVLVTHSDMTPAQRRSVWLNANNNKDGLIIIGPRSALFSPLKNIGLIVIDECHDSAYKQEQAPYYQTSRVAAHLAHLHGARFMMGSATPSIADYFTFEQKKLSVLRMTEPAIKNNQETSLDVIDQRDKKHFTRSSWLANTMIKAIEQAITNGEQSLLFLNRRGSARLVLCDTCGWQALCPHCDVALTYHQDQHTMRCHSCDFKDGVPTSCPSCNASELIFRSIGTKALETEIHRLFPGARVGRFDRDTEKSLRLNQQYQALQAGDIDILIGTQTIAKGFDLPKLSVVGIVQADSGLQIPDYSATERTYQLLSQVSGRIGRGHRTGKLFVQTFDPNSSLISLAMQKNYQDFYSRELKQRHKYGFPPYNFLLKITCSRSTSRGALLACKKIAENIQQSVRYVIIEGPSPRFIEKVANRYAWHLVVKSKNRKRLLEIVRELPSNTSYDLDPSDLL